MASRASASKGGQRLPPGDGLEGTDFNGYQKTELRDKRKSAEIGFMRMDIVDPPQGTHWGEFNDRVVDPKWVESLALSFERNLDNCTDESAIEVAVRAKWLKDASKAHSTVEGKRIKEVELMEFTDEGRNAIANNNLWVLGGNHRREALKLYITRKKKELEEKRKEVGGLEAGVKQGPKGGPATAGTGQDLDALKITVQTLEDQIEASPYWAVKLYDRDKIEAHPKPLATAIFRFMSRNELKGSRMATDEERLQEIVDQLKDAYVRDLHTQSGSLQDEDAATRYPEFTEEAKKLSNEYKDARGHRRLCSVPSFALGLVMVSRFWRHYKHAPWFKIATLSKMLEAHGAIISEFLVESVDVLERIANPNEPPLDRDTIEELGAKMLESSCDQGDDTQKKLAGMKKAFKGRGDATAWNAEVLAKVDECFVRNYYESGSPCDSLFFPENPDNLNRFTQYCSDVDKALKVLHKIAPPYAREYFAYAMIWTQQGHSFPMPLGTATVIHAVHTLLVRYREGLDEAVSWLGTCVYWVPKMNAKVYMVHDPLEAALTVASTDLLLKTNATGVRRKIYRILFSHLTTSIVQMEIYLMSNRIPRSLIKDLSVFKGITTRHKATSVKSLKTPSKSGKETKEKVHKESVEVTEFLAAVQWTSEKFLSEYDANYKLMDKARFDRNDRLSDRLGTRILTMSGVPWNHNSRNRFRDWSLIAVAVTVETALIEHYRKTLIDQCSGARALRKDLSDFLLSCATRHSVLVQGKTRSTYEWEFADNLSHSASNSEDSFVLEDLMKQWADAHSALLKDSNDPLSSVIETLEKNKYLACSDVDAPPGAIETLAHHLISGLAKIMYKNRARIEHNKGDNGDDERFDMASVIVPDISRRTHAVSKEYRTELGYDQWGFDQSASNKAAPSSIPHPSTSTTCVPSSASALRPPVGGQHTSPSSPDESADVPVPPQGADSVKHSLSSLTSFPQTQPERLSDDFETRQRSRSLSPPLGGQKEPVSSRASSSDRSSKDYQANIDEEETYSPNQSPKDYQANIDEESDPSPPSRSDALTNHSTPSSPEENRRHHKKRTRYETDDPPATDAAGSSSQRAAYVRTRNSRSNSKQSSKQSKPGSSGLVPIDNPFECM